MSIENEEARLLWDKTLSIKELVEELKDEITSRITRMRLLSIISKDKEVPHYRIFGEKRYKYEDCKDYIMRTYKTR